MKRRTFSARLTAATAAPFVWMLSGSPALVASPPPPVPSDVKEWQNLAESAWGLIANAHGGDWDLASKASGWKPAAIRWREAYRKIRHHGDQDAI